MVAVLNSPLAVSIIGGVAASLATVIIQNIRGNWLWFRKARRWVTFCIARWWTRNSGYIPRYARGRDFRHAQWWRTGPYWLDSPPSGYPADGRGPRDRLGRPKPPDRIGIVPWGQ